MKPDRAAIELVETFAHKIINRNFADAHYALAPWLQERISPEDLKTAIDAEIRETLEACGETEACQPRSFEIDWNSSTIESLKEPCSYAPTRSIDDQVTNDNFKHWLCIQFQPEQDSAWDLDAFFDMWLIIVELETGLAVGYYEMLEPD